MEYKTKLTYKEAVDLASNLGQVRGLTDKHVIVVSRAKEKIFKVYEDLDAEIKSLVGDEAKAAYPRLAETLREFSLSKRELSSIAEAIVTIIRDQGRTVTEKGVVIGLCDKLKISGFINTHCDIESIDEIDLDGDIID